MGVGFLGLATPSGYIRHAHGRSAYTAQPCPVTKGHFLVPASIRRIDNGNFCWAPNNGRVYFSRNSVESMRRAFLSRRMSYGVSTIETSPQHAVKQPRHAPQAKLNRSSSFMRGWSWIIASAVTTCSAMSDLHCFFGEDIGLERVSGPDGQRAAFAGQGVKPVPVRMRLPRTGRASKSSHERNKGTHR